MSDAARLGMTQGVCTTKGKKTMKIAKRVKANNALVDKSKVYTPEEAIELAKKTANTKFVGSVEVHIRTLIDAKKTDQSVRGTVSLPNGTGKTKRVAAFVTEAKEKEAKDKLNLQSPDENVVIVEQGVVNKEAPKENDNSETSIPLVRQVSNPLKWWNYFFNY